MNPDQDVRADCEIDILKEEENFTNGDIENFYDEEELGTEYSLKQKIYLEYFRKEAGKVEAKSSLEKESEYFHQEKVINILIGRI